MIGRRKFLQTAGGAVMLTASGTRFARGQAPSLEIRDGDDLFSYIRRDRGEFDQPLYRQILGGANAYKEGDEIVGVAAVDEGSRQRARDLLSRTRLRDIDAHPLLDDELHRLLRESLDPAIQSRLGSMSVGDLKRFLLIENEPAIQAILPGLSSDVIGCVVKLMSDGELTAVGAKVFHPLPGSRIGAPGYLGARIQPNSPTDDVDEIRWQVFDGWAYAVGDVVLGNNPVSSDPASVLAIEETLKEVLETFELTDVMPHCVLSHIDVQAEVERTSPGSTALWFQSIAGSVAANATFDVTIEKMLQHAAARTGRYGLYFETGQGADFTNGHAQGVDMVIHESRKYGFARLLSQKVQAAREAAGRPGKPWVHVNDVAGFIGPEVFRTKEQLVRCCLEDIVMGKLHGLCIGLDVCSTLHMSVSLDDLDWCLDQVLPACPAYLMALPTKIDPMLGYLTTSYQDHVRLREKFGRRVNDRMWTFFQELGVIDAAGRPTAHFGDPLWVYLQYCRRKGDDRADEVILGEGRRKLSEIRDRGVFLATGHGARAWDLEPHLEQSVRRIYSDSKESIWAELKPEFVATIPSAVPVQTRSEDREDYILHPVSGEQLSEASLRDVRDLRKQHAGRYDVQIVVSDGLNALAIMDDGHLQPMLDQLRSNLTREGLQVAPENLVVTSGRVRAGYQIGAELFGGLEGPRAIVHLIGERPGSGHHTMSAYLTVANGETWKTTGRVDHNITRVVAGIARTSLPPTRGADDASRILGQMWKASP